MIQLHDDVCKVLCEDNDKTLTAEVLEFKEGKFLSVSIQRTLKINLNWNGRIYEGRSGKLSFVSEGPIIRKVKQVR
jgi:hypothetical protein